MFACLRNLLSCIISQNVLPFHDFPLDFYQHYGDNILCARYNACVDKLTNNWNLYKKSTRPLSTKKIWSHIFCDGWQ